MIISNLFIIVMLYQNMNTLIILLAIATFISTLSGGFVILKFKNGLHYFFAFSAGSLMGVAFLDLLPESLQIANNSSIPIRSIMIAIVLSFLFYHLIERFFVMHDIEHDDNHGHIMGPIGAGSLVIHSLLDGVAIGAAFQVNASIGLIVALAVLFHDFTDGINTVTLMLKNKQKRSKAIMFLILDAIAPVIGVFLVSLVIFPEKILAIILAIFVGEFIYIGASNLLPATQQFHSKKILIAMAGGLFLIMILTSLL
jgi:zinc transporter ZupT